MHKYPDKGHKDTAQEEKQPAITANKVMSEQMKRHNAARQKRRAVINTSEHPPFRHLLLLQHAGRRTYHLVPQRTSEKVRTVHHRHSRYHPIFIHEETHISPSVC